ncbi:MAG TPA: ATP-binding protein [Acidimicrobiales bacterium]|nr:ATP-binding protein [Acidimicrobiales bacterium]
MHDTSAASDPAEAPVRGSEPLVGHEQCLRRTLRFTSALDRVGEGVVITDADGTEVYRNDTARRLATAHIAGPLASSAIAEQLAAARRDGPNERVLEMFVPVRRVLVIRASPLVDGGIVDGSVAVVEDISERRRVDAIRRDFVANVSHELKTPVGALSLLAETLDGEDDPETVTRLSGRLTAEAERLARLIDDLLDLSRIEAHEAPVVDDVTVQSVIAEAVGAARPLADAAGIELGIEEPAAGLYVEGDRWELVSALRNLVDNAVKYTERGGRVVVSARRWAAGDGVELSVRDTGIGIPARDRERVFERFYRVDRARSRSTGGTGLGLSIVRHVAANHGGDVRLESEEGVGSTFTLVLPRGGARSAAAGAPTRGIGA